MIFLKTVFLCTLLQLVSCYVVEIGSTNPIHNDQYLNGTYKNILIQQNSSLIDLLQVLDVEKEGTCQSGYLSVMDDAYFQYIMEILLFNCQKLSKYFHPSRIKLAMEDYREHDIEYQDSYITDTYQVIAREGNPRVGILTYGICDNFFVSRLSTVLLENNIYVLCDSINNADSLSVHTILTNFQKVNFLVLALSSTDTELCLDYYSTMKGDLANVVTYGFSQMQSDSLKQEFLNIEIINIPFNDQKNSTRYDVGLVDVGKVKEYFNQSSTSQYEYHRLNNLAMESMYSNISSLSKQLRNDSLSYQKQKIYVNCTSAIYAPFIFILSDYFPDSVGHCQLGRPCHVPNVTLSGTFWSLSCCHGLAIELMDAVAEELDFYYDLRLVEDGAFGALNNGKWNGMIGQLDASLADIAIQGLTPTSPRSQVVDFSPGYIKTHLGIVRRVVTRELKIVNWEFLDPLEFWLMICILFSTVASVTMIYFIENSTWFFTGSPHFPFRESMTYVFGLTFQRDMGGKNPLKWSGRFVALGYALAMTIVMTTYTAHITANNIRYTDDDGFKGLLDNRITDPSSKYVVAAMANTSSETFFKNNPLQVYKNVHSKMVLLPNDMVGVAKVYSGEIDAFLSDNIYVQSIISQHKYCTTITMYDEMRRQTEVAYAMRKGFYLTPHITRVVLKLLENGFVDELLKKWLYVPNCSTYQSEDQKFPWFYFGGILLFLGICSAVSILVNVLENFYTYIKSQRTGEEETMNDEWKMEHSRSFSPMVQNAYLHHEGD